MNTFGALIFGTAAQTTHFDHLSLAAREACDPGPMLLVNGEAIIEDYMGIHQKMKDRTTLLPNNSTCRYLSQENKRLTKGYMYPHVHYNTIYNSQWKQPKCPSLG